MSTRLNIPVGAQTAKPNEARQRLEFLRAALPESGLLAHGNWLLSPEPFPLSPDEIAALEHLGYHFKLFYRACDLLYRQSVNGKKPAWVADILDAGKPPELIKVARSKSIRHALPRIIRPDLLLTHNGWAASELDNLPGGIGLTAWLNETYAQLGYPVVGGESGMLDGFASVCADADIVISEEASDYRAEMEWIAKRIAERGTVLPPRVVSDNNWQSTGRQFYRFFELFDLENVKCASQALAEVQAGRLNMTPPPKPWLEEKLLFAMFWLSPLQNFWRRELGERHFERLKAIIPYTWIIDPQPLPYHAVLPRLEINSWESLGQFSQTQRNYVLKISGFSPLAWGSRGVHIGSDLSQHDWQTALKNAVQSFPANPWILQEFKHSRIVVHPYYDKKTGKILQLRGRVRLCPYYFVGVDETIKLGGVLATIAPADKKLVHGMRDAILAPCALVRHNVG